MTISYDVYTMQELARACQAANDQLHNAQNLILQVRSHNDWTCKEKDAIDDLMQECKNIVKRLCEEQFSFLEVIKSVGEEMLEAENSVSRLFNGVESLLEKILSIPVVETVIQGTGLLTDNIKDVFEDIASIIREEPVAPVHIVPICAEIEGVSIDDIAIPIGGLIEIGDFEVDSILTSTINISSAPTLDFR